MCPVCLATAALIAGSATGTGGLTALVARTLRKRRSDKPSPTIAKKEDHDVREPDRGSSPQDGLSR
jgi:hypothetical protein